jgi:predicted N-acetyltransferase YhbS
MTLPFDFAALDAAVPFLGDFAILAEAPEDAPARETLLEAAFGAQRFEKTSERLRAGRLPADGLALVAKDGDALVGTVRLWSVRAGGVDALMLGPLAVARSRRGVGVGARLMREASARAAERGHQAILLVGDAPYYARFGFAASPTERLALPGPVDRARFLGLELVSGALRNAEGLVAATGARDPHGFAPAPRAGKRAATIGRLPAQPSLPPRAGETGSRKAAALGPEAFAGAGA